MTLLTVALQAPLSMGFFSQALEWVAIFSSRGIFPTQGSNPRLLCLLHCRVTLPAEPPGRPPCVHLAAAAVVLSVGVAKLRGGAEAVVPRCGRGQAMGRARGCGTLCGRGQATRRGRGRMRSLCSEPPWDVDTWMPACAAHTWENICSPSQPTGMVRGLGD